MKRGFFINIFLILTSLFLFSCADTTTKSNSSGKKNSANKVTPPLTEEEKYYKATTTIYYVPSFDASEVNDCPANKKVNLLNKAGHIITKACKNIFDACAMQGTCRVTTAYGRLELLNVDGVKNGVRRFKIISDDVCKYGFGASSDREQKFKKMCLEPFYTVAADLSLYRLGDVLFFPDIKGLVLPNGEVHDGFMVVRDVGGNIKGRGRFDVFTGGYGLSEGKNPFAKIKLHDKDTRPKYFVAEGSEAERILEKRQFPLIP